jgi:hypothetical protein
MYFVFSFINVGEAVTGIILTMIAGSMSWQGMVGHGFYTFAVTAMAVWMWASYHGAATFSGD